MPSPQIEWPPDAQGGVDHPGDRLAEVFADDEAPAHVEQVLVGDRGLAGGHALEPGVGAEAVQAEEQALLQHGAVEILVAVDRVEGVGEADAQVGLLEHVEQAGHRPALADLGLERDQALGLRLLLERRQRDPPATSPQDANVRVLREAAVERLKRLDHVGAHASNEGLGVPRQAERGVVRVPVDLEVGRQILVGVAVAVGTHDPDLLAAQPLAQRFQDADLVGDPVDPLPALAVRLEDGVPPSSGTTPSSGTGSSTG